MNPLDPATYAELLNRWLNQLPVAYAFGAGMLASVNPCGFLMLPAYAIYYVSTDDRRQGSTSGLARGMRAVQLGLLATLGFLAVFAPLGAVLSLGGRRLVRFFPYSSLVMGLVLLVLGTGLLVSRRRLALGYSERVRLRRSKSVRGVFLFGVGYAVASLGCTLPIFIVVVGSALSTQGALSGLVQLLNYALGMGLVLTLVSLSAALTQTAITARLQRLLPYVERAGGLLLIAVGVYLVYYWYRFGRLLT
jgi:cytochrome c-type biogenesis protein